MSILVATGFVRIDSDTKPALKALKAFGAIGGQALSTGLIPAAAAATAAIGGIASAAAVAGGAVTAYGVAVGQQFSQITDAMTKQTAAQDAQTKATNAETVARRLAKEGGFQYGQQIKITADMTDAARARAENYNSALGQAQSATKAATLAQQTYKTQLGQMPKATSDTAEALQNLKSSTKSWSDSLAGSTMPVFTQGIKFLTSLLPKLTPIVQNVATEVQGFVNSLGEGTAGKVFREFGKNVQEHGASTLRTFLDIALNVAVGIGGVLNAFMPFAEGVTGGLEKLSQRFAEWGAGLGSSKGFGQFMDLAKDAGPKLTHLLSVLADTFVKVASAAGPLSGIGLTMITVFAELVDAIPTPVLKLLVPAIIATNLAFKLYAIYASIAAGITWAFGTAAGASRVSVLGTRLALIGLRIATIASAVATGVMTVATYALSVAMAILTSPIGIIILVIAALAAGFIIAWKKSETFRDIVKTALGAVVTAAKAVGRFFTETIPAAFQTVVQWLKDHWKLIPIIFGPIGLAVSMILVHWNTLSKFFSDTWDWLKAHVFSPIATFFNKTIPDAAKTVRDKTVDAWNWIKDKVTGAWDYVKKHAFDPIANFFSKTLPGAAKTAREKVVDAFRWLLDKVLGVFGGIIGGAAKIFGWVPGVGGKLKQASKAFNKFRDDVNAALGGIKDRKPTVDTKFRAVLPGSHSLMATGGPVYGPGTETSDSIPVWLSRNEHVLSAREVRGLGGHRNVERMRAEARAGMLGYAYGGAVGVTPKRTSASRINSITGQSVIYLLNKYAKTIYDSVITNVGPSGSGIKRWTNVVQSALMQLRQPLTYTALTLRRMNQESGGNPNAVNRWDSNWQAGHPSVGLMQVIRGTFQHYAGKYLHTGPFMYGVSTNPMANVYASMRYALGAYGSIPRAYNRAGGYANGTAGTASGWHMFGERGPELGYSPAGWRVLNARKTSSVERTPVISINRLVLENHGVIGSQHEVENWLVTTLDQLRRHNRIPAV